MSNEEIEQLAAKVARALFTAGNQEVAQRIALVIDVPTKRDLGGWNERAATRQIARVLRAELSR